MQNNSDLCEHVNDLVKQANELLTRASLALNNGLVVDPAEGVEVESDESVSPSDGDGIWDILRKNITLAHGLALGFSYEPVNNYYRLTIGKTGTGIIYCRMPIFKPSLTDDFGYKLNLLDQVKNGLNHNLLNFEAAQDISHCLTFDSLVLSPLDKSYDGLMIPSFMGESMSNDIKAHQVYLRNYTKNFTDEAKEKFLRIAAEQYKEVSYKAMYSFLSLLYDLLIPKDVKGFFEHCALDFYDFRPKINLAIRNGEPTIKPTFEVIFDGFNTVNLTMDVLTDDSKQSKFIARFYDYLCESLHSRILSS